MSKMENLTGNGPAPRPEAANPHNAKGSADGLNGGDNSKPVLSLVGEAHSGSTHVEDGFFAKGADDDKAALEMYAAMLPTGFSWKRINPRALLIAGGTALLLIGVAAGRLLPHGPSMASAPAEDNSPVVIPALAAPAAAAPAPAQPAPAPVAVAPAAPSPAPAAAEPAVGTPALAAAPTTPDPAPAAKDPEPAAAPTPVAALAPGAAEPVAAKEDPAAAAPTPAVAVAPAEKPTPEKPAAEPTVAAAPEPKAAAEPVAKPEPVAKAEPMAKPEPVAKPVEAAPAQPTTAVAGAEAPGVQACRDALKKRDLKLVTAKCETALASDSSLAKPLLAFAKGQFEKGKSAQAAVLARRIVQVNNSLADAYLIMGAAEQEARHAAAAKTAYQRYLELAPKGPYAEDVRSSLKSL